MHTLVIEKYKKQGAVTSDLAFSSTGTRGSNDAVRRIDDPWIIAVIRNVKLYPCASPKIPCNHSTNNKLTRGTTALFIQ